MTDTALRAFKLESDISLEDLNGATTSFGPNAETLDVKEALEESGGTIVADHPAIISTLRGVAILDEVDVPEGAEPTPIPVTLDTGTPDPSSVGVIPQGAPPDQLGVPQEAEAVHAEEPDTVQGAAEQPASQAGAPEEAPSQDPSPSPRPARFQ